jgi:hypothetical protein
MILRLDTPSLQVLRWHRDEGDEVGFGELLVELRAEEHVSRIQPVAVPRRRFGSKAARPVVDEQTGDSVKRRAGRFRVEIIASEGAYLRRIVAPVGGTVTTGDALAVLSSSPDEHVGPDVPAAHSFRVVADVIRLDSDLLAEDP